MVATTRGAVRKRTGSTLFTVTGSFPALGVTDAFGRGEENPLSNGGKWSTITGAAGTGRAFAEWGPSTSFPAVYGARWNPAEQASPAVSLEATLPPSGIGRYFGVWCCLAAAAKSGYFVRWEATETGLFTVTLERWTAGVKAVLSTLTNVALAAGDSVGVSAAAGTVTVWQKHAGVWTALTSALDGTYATGYTGMEASGTGGKYDNFSFGGIGGALEGIELHSLFAATIGGVKWLVAAGGGKLFSISSTGVVTQIGTGFDATARWSMVQAPASVGVAGQGPVYMVNGVNQPQYWAGSGTVKPWTGAPSEPSHADGKSTNASVIYEAASAEFFPTDVGIAITGTNIPAGTTVVKYISATQIELSAAATGSGSGLAFTIKRQYYAPEPHVPNGQFMVFAGNRIWMTGLSGDTSAVWFSDIVSTGEGGGQGDPSAWPTTNVVRFDGSDGSPITGIGTVGPYLVVFKEHKTWIVHDLNTGANRRLADNIGCVAHRSIVETAMGTFFLTADQGVYLTDGARLHEMSYSVRPTLLAVNQQQRQNAAGCYYNNHYYLSIPYQGSATNNRTLDYDVQLKSWWLHDLVGNQWAAWEPGTEANLYACAPGAGKGVVRAFVPNVYTDVGAPYTGLNGLSAYWFGAWQVFSMFIFRHRIATPFLKKRIRQVHFDGSGEIIPMVAKGFSAQGQQTAGVVDNTPADEATLPVNFSSGEGVFGDENPEHVFGGGELIFGGAAVTHEARLYSLGVSRAWSVGFGNATGAPFEVDSYTYFIQFRKG